MLAMRTRSLAHFVIALLALAVMSTPPTVALPLAGLLTNQARYDVVEVKTGLEAGKLCAAIRSCTFSRKAVVRGCLSSYSCRQCDFVKRCSGGRCEWRSRCGWGSAGS
jgi:hypothetical protein